MIGLSLRSEKFSVLNIRIVHHGYHAVRKPDLCHLAPFLEMRAASGETRPTAFLRLTARPARKPAECKSRDFAPGGDRCSPFCLADFGCKGAAGLDVARIAERAACMEAT